ncbi:MAG TPA: endonuclease/exonuclease/phosphatase family protein [Microlunatus sp.]
MTYNVHRWGDDRTALAEVITTCKPELLMVQEAPTWWGTRRRRLGFADSIGLSYLAGEARTAAFVSDPTRWSIRTKRIWRPALRRRKSYWIPQLPGGAVALTTTINPSKINSGKIDSGKIESGKINSGQLNGVQLSVLGCHLGLSNSGRVVEMDQLLGMVRDLADACVVVGDVNEPAGGPVWRLAGQAGLIDAAAKQPTMTFPSAEPRARIDAVWTSATVRADVVDLGAIGLDHSLLVPASDHLPLVIDLVVSPS